MLLLMCRYYYHHRGGGLFFIAKREKEIRITWSSVVMIRGGVVEGDFNGTIFIIVQG